MSSVPRPGPRTRATLMVLAGIALASPGGLAGAILYAAHSRVVMTAISRIPASIKTVSG